MDDENRAIGQRGNVYYASILLTETKHQYMCIMHIDAVRFPIVRIQAVVGKLEAHMIFTFKAVCASFVFVRDRRTATDVRIPTIP